MKRLVFIVLLLFPLFVFAKEQVEFSKCVDGDTFKIVMDNEIKTVRMLAIDTPESVHPTKEAEKYGKKASEYTYDLLTSAKKIELEYDNNSDKLDKYNRVLAWVFVDDYLLQDILVRNGYAEVAYLYNEYKYTNILKEHETLAKLEKLNIWSEEDTNDIKTEEVSIYVVIISILLAIISAYVKKKLKKINKKSKIKFSLN